MIKDTSRGQSVTRSNKVKEEKSKGYERRRCTDTRQVKRLVQMRRDQMIEDNSMREDMRTDEIKGGRKLS